MFDSDSTTTAKIEAEILPFEMGYLPEFFQKKREMELNYTQKVKESSLLELKEMITKSDLMKGVLIEDEFLSVFLTSRKYDVDRAFTQLKKLLNFRRNNDSMFKVPPFEVLSVFMTSELITVLPWRCQDGCSIILIQLGKCNAVQHPVEAIKQFYAIFLLQCLRYPMTQVNGFKVIIDLNVTSEVLKICTPENLYLLYYGTQVVLPGRFKGIHIINMGAIGKTVWQIMSIFLGKKIKDRVRFHDSNDTLLDFFPRAVIPTKYSGDLTEYDQTEWLKKVVSPEELQWCVNIFS